MLLTIAEHCDIIYEFDVCGMKNKEHDYYKVSCGINSVLIWDVAK